MSALFDRSISTRAVEEYIPYKIYCNIFIFIFSLKTAAVKIEYIYCAPKDLKNILQYILPQP